MSSMGMMNKRNVTNKEMRMTEGPYRRQIVMFAIPLFFGNLFQQLYNTADSLIVGNARGPEALAAVSSSASLISLFIGFFNGISMGAGVVISRYYGADDREKVQKAIHTSVMVGLLSGILLTFAGILFTPYLLRLMGTPENVLLESIRYFRVYFAGALGLVMYNIFMGIYSAVGDSRHPLYYLILSSCLNVVLDILFVPVLGYGVGAAALATIISQFLSALISAWNLLKAPEVYRLHPGKISLDKAMTGQILRNGIPAGIQHSIISLGNVVVQSNINAFGAMAMAGCGSYSKIEGFGFLPVTCFVSSLTTFVGQNTGAGNTERAKKGAAFGITLSVIIAELIGLTIWSFGPQLITLFTKEPEAIQYGVTYARTVSLFFCLLAFSHCAAGILRGAGKPILPTVIMVSDWCAFRVLYVTLAVRLWPSIRTVVTAYPVTWSISTVIFLFYLLRGSWAQPRKD